MKVSTFFKVLNNKINKYDNVAVNPFTIPQPIVLIWVEEFCEDDGESSSKG